MIVIHVATSLSAQFGAAIQSPVGNDECVIRVRRAVFCAMPAAWAKSAAGDAPRAHATHVQVLGS